MSRSLPMALVLSIFFTSHFAFAQGLVHQSGFEFVQVPDLMSGTNPPHLMIARDAPTTGEEFTDANFGTDLTCVTETDYIHSRHEYARFDPYNSNQSRIILDPDVRWRVYSTASYPYNLPGNLVMEIDLEEPRWDPENPDVIWGLYDFSIRTVNLSTKTYTVVKDFEQDPLIGPIIGQEPVFRITTRDEGESSIDKRYWAFFLQGNEVVDYRPRYIFTWDGQQDKIIGLYEVAPNEVDIDYLGMSTYGNWVIIGGDDWNGGNLQGLTVANPELTEFWNVGRIGHQDVGLTKDKKEVLVGQNTATDHVDLIVLGPNPQSIPLIRLLYQDSSPYGMQSGIHVSCNMPGYCVISSYIEQGLQEKNWLDRSIILVELDLQDPKGYYLAKVHGTMAPGSYYEETHASITNDGSKVVWASNWNQNVGQEEVFLMQLNMPENWSGVSVQDPQSLPDGFRLHQNAPNPFNPTTTIRYSIPSLSSVTIKVFDLLGSEISTVLSKEQPAGRYEVAFDAGTAGQRVSLSSGVYVYQLSADGYRETKKMIFIR